MAKVIVTGAYGCIGSWVTRLLLLDGHDVIAADVGDQRHRHTYLVDGIVAKGTLTSIQLDITDFELLKQLIARENPDAVIHLAALQLPFCKANPLRGVDVNVRGVLGFLELKREFGFNFVYASSAAVYGPDLGRPIGEHENLTSQSLYGVFKRTDEEMARIYDQDYGVRSIGIRPWTVYGPGRDQGLTADCTLALFNAARGEPYHIKFSGTTAFEHGDEVAAAFIKVALNPVEGTRVHSLGGPIHTIAEVADLIGELTGRPDMVTVDPAPLGIGCEVTDESFQACYGPFPYRSLEEGFKQSLNFWRSSDMI